MRIFLSCCLLAVSLVSCTKKNSHPDYFGTVIPQHPADEMWTDAGGEPQYMDPAQVADSVSAALTNSMFVRLTEIHPTSQKPVPDLALRWDVSDDGREFVFYLRKDAKWSDGKKLTAHDVEYSWKRLLNPATVSTYSQMGDIIQNGRAYREVSIAVSGLKDFGVTAQSAMQAKLPKEFDGLVEVVCDPSILKYFIYIKSNQADEKKQKRTELIQWINQGSLGAEVTAEITSDEVVQVKALDDARLQVKLESSAPYFISLIAHLSFAPVPKHVIAKFEAQGHPELWTRAENIVVSGAFKLVEEEFKQYKIYKKNPLFYDADKVRLNKVKAVLIENAQPTMNAYKVGQHDWSSSDSYPAEFVDEIKKYKDVWFAPKTAVYYYQFNTKVKPLDDKRVRQALALSIDRQAIADNILKMGQVPSRDILIDGLSGYKSIYSEQLNIEKAKKLLADAGYPEGKGFPKLLIKFNTFESHRKIATAVQEMWKKNLNINIEIANMEWRTLIEDQNAGNFQIMRMAWIADYVDPYTFMNIFLSHSTNNHTYWGNEKYDELIAQSDFERDVDKRMALFQEAEKILTDEQPVMPIFWYAGTKQVKPYVKGIWPSLIDKYNWKYMWIDDRWYSGVPEDPDAIENKPWK